MQTYRNRFRAMECSECAKRLFELIPRISMRKKACVIPTHWCNKFGRGQSRLKTRREIAVPTGCRSLMTYSYWKHCAY